MPPLADGFAARPETAPGFPTALTPGAVVVLINGLTAGTPQRGQLAACGKTQLAVYFAESLWWSREVDLLVWVTATSRASVLSGYVQAAAAAGIDPAGTGEQVAARFAGWLAETARPWLVVLDDLRDAADLDGLWPHGPAGQVLITTADKQAVARAPQAQILPVGALSTREALNYLRGRLTVDPDQRHGAIDLAAELGGDPGALTQASAVLATSRLTCRDYKHHFAQRRERLALRTGGVQPTAATVTCIISAEQAERLAPGRGTQLLLGLAALLGGGQAIPATVLTAPAVCAYLAQAGAEPAGPGDAWDAVLTLERTGLLAIGETSPWPAAWMSRAVAAQVQAAMPEDMLARAARAAADALTEGWPKDECPPWLAACLRSCAASLLQTAPGQLWEHGGCHRLLLQTGQSLDAARLTGPAARYWAQLATASQKSLGPDHPATLTAGSGLARALLAAGRPGEAVAWSRWVADGYEHTLGPAHPGAIAARVSLGHALAAAGRPGHAVPVLDKAVARYERAFGPGHPDAMGARDELAAACLAAGNPAAAIGHYQRMLACHEDNQGPRHPDTITARDNLARACLADGRINEAITHYKRALADWEQALGPDHLDTITARRNLAAAYRTAGKIADALRLYEHVCADHERILGADDSRTLTRRTELAHAYHDAGRLTDAATLFRDTLARCEQALPPGDPLTQALRQAITGTADG
jgi:tetratricopeptide (TPR) repeat protein